ncbi:MAG: ABC transporter substrate-binding protein [Anaerolineae bacterium]
MSNKAFRLILAVAVMVGMLAVPSVMAQDDLVFPIGEDDRFTWESYEEFAAAYDLEGQEVSILGPWLGVDNDLFTSVIAYFEEATGATVNYAGSDSFEQQIVIDIEGGSPPNIAVFPQPGLAADLASQGGLVPLGDELGQWVEDNYGAGTSWRSFGTYADENGEEQYFAFPYKQDVKSLVWYVPDEFEFAGYEIPETMEDLLALSEQMVADGNTPWCIGLGSGDATGWPATDWVEDIMLRTQPLDVYDAWVAHEIPFNDEAVVNAIEIFGNFAKNDEWVNGGASAVATTDFRDAPQGLFQTPPQCYMHRQASFIPSFFPEDAEPGVDYNAFYFPPFESEEELGRPVLGAGTLFAITEDNEVARAFIEFLKTPFAHEVWMAQSGLLTAHQGVNLDAYANDVLASMGQVLSEAESFRFDASDLMPGAIGAGAFWTGMVDFVNGVEAQAAADSIEETWAGLD